jgi:hypothetical protein
VCSAGRCCVRTAQGRVSNRVGERRAQFLDVGLEPVERREIRRADPLLLIQPATEGARLHPHPRGQYLLTDAVRDQAQGALA